MPIITVEGPKMALEKKREFAERTTQAFHEIFGHPKNIITVLFHENTPENVAAGGEMLIDIFAKQPPKDKNQD